MAVNCAILSYNGTVYFGFSGDTHAAPDLRRMQTLLQESFFELRNAIGIPPLKKKKVAKKPRAAAKVLDTSVVRPNLPVSISGGDLPQFRPVPEPAPSHQDEKVLTQLVVA